MIESWDLRRGGGDSKGVWGGWKGVIRGGIVCVVGGGRGWKGGGRWGLRRRKGGGGVGWVRLVDLI